MSTPTAPAHLTAEPTPAIFHRISWPDIAPHLRFGLLLTGSFVVAWGWDLALYALSHAVAGQNPLQHQIGFAHQQQQQLAPKYLVVLVGHYLLVCGVAAFFSHQASQVAQPWSPAAVRAVEFVPSPVFAGKLMAFLSQFGQLGPIQQGLLNLAVTGLAAVLAHTLPRCDTGNATLARFTPIVQNTLGFGLGIAWNVFLQRLLAPNNDNNNDDDEFDIIQFVAMGLYLAMVFLLAMRVAALKHELPPTETPSFWERQCELASFAMQVVCAFTLATFLDYCLHSTWFGTIQAIAMLLLISAILSAVVASVDLEALRQQQQQDEYNGESSSFCTCLLWIPCLWCCCPWIPVLVLLSHMDAAASTKSLQEDWYALIAMVTGLAASIEAANLVTLGVDSLLAPFCTSQHCSAPWAFCVLQVSVALVTTVVLLPLLGALCDYATDAPEPQEEKEEEGDGVMGEKQGLLSA